MTRRHFFKDGALGFGSLALTALLNRNVLAGPEPAKRTDPMAPKPPHFAPKAKRIIYLFMSGAPSHVDLWDYKPKLDELDGKTLPPSLLEGERFAFVTKESKVLGNPFKFRRAGKAGIWISDLLPHTSEVVDDLCVIRSMNTEQFNHGPAQIFMNTGHQIVGRPCMGSWLTYGLGSVSADLPGFVVLLSGGGLPDAGRANWSCGFIPTSYQGVEFRSQGDPVLAIADPAGMSREVRRESLDAVQALNRARLADVGDPEIRTRIEAYEMAFRMQASVPELMDIASEPKEVHELYGTEPGQAAFSNNCLLARRLIERGVRFVQLYHRGWDHHGSTAEEDLNNGLPRQCRNIDRACAALIKDLKQRGLLEDTLVIWGGEFGRTPMNEARFGSAYLGRDHNPKAFTVWLAGAGVKPGHVHGTTDDLGFRVVEDPVPVHDLQATVLHLMGIDHKKLTFRFQGRDFRLTDVHGNLVQKILA